jgi:hypothetical protein
VEANIHRLCVFNLDHYELGPDRRSIVPLEELARSFGTSFEAIDASTIVLSPDSLLALLGDVSHYNLSLFHVPDSWPTSVIEDAVIAMTEPPREASNLLQFPESKLYLNSHDDCYLQIECREESLPASQLGVLLQQYAEALLKLPVMQPDLSLCRTILELSQTLCSTAKLCKLGAQETLVGLSKDRWIPNGSPEPRVDITLSVDSTNSRWSLVG